MSKGKVAMLVFLFSQLSLVHALISRRIIARKSGKKEDVEMKED